MASQSIGGGTGRPRNTALKDAQLTYRASTLGYAESLQLASPNQLVGQTDFDFLSDRGAALVHAAELRVLETGTAEITAGEVLSKRTAGKYFVRSPVFNHTGQICGIEISVVSVDELHRSYQLLLGTELQLRDVINQSPFGLLIHRNYELIYVNARWLELMGSAGSSPGAAEIRQLVPGNEEGQVKTIRSVNAEGDEFDLRLQSCAVRWNGTDAKAVYCVPDQTQNSNTTFNMGSSTSDQNSFVEKRHGHRGDGTAPLPDPLLASDGEFFKNINQPMVVCEDWVPVQANTAAKALLQKDTNNNYQPVSDWFSDRDRASIEAISGAQRSVDQFVTTRIERNDQSFSAYVSNVLWDERSLVLISLQPVAMLHTELEHTIDRLTDYASAAGDFFWEMDADQRMTHISMEMKEFLGVDSSSLINMSLATLITKYVHEDDLGEWKVLLVDLKKHLPFRDREYVWQHVDGEKRVVRLSGVPVFDLQENHIGYRGVGWDCTSQHHSASIVAYHASHDSLTGLVNRREFELRCNDAISRTSAANQALCFIDLDNFKRVNDTAGHLAGDELLRQLSTLFTNLVRKSDVLARLGGDEFGLLIYGVGLTEAMRLAAQLRAEVESFLFLWEGKSFSVGASIGLVMIDERWNTRSALFSAADAACYEAKHKGRNRVAVFTEAEATTDHKSGEQHHDEYIKDAIKERRIKLALQRIAAPGDPADTSSKIEVLMRLPSPEGEPLLPAAVMPLAERFGLSVQLDTAVIDATLDWLEGQPHVTDGLELCCINLSGAALNDEEFLKDLLRKLKASAIDPSILCFEVSESAVSTNLTAVSGFMDELGALGCKFSMDDFSGGLNSFNYLKKLPVNFVKINSTFVRAIMEDPIHYAMVKSINDVAQTLGKQTIAESVESEDVLEKLLELGVNLVQGYHISAPEMIDF